MISKRSGWVLRHTASSRPPPFTNTSPSSPAGFIPFYYIILIMTVVFLLKFNNHVDCVAIYLLPFPRFFFFFYHAAWFQKSTFKKALFFLCSLLENHVIVFLTTHHNYKKYYYCFILFIVNTTLHCVYLCLQLIFILNIM